MKQKLSSNRREGHKISFEWDWFKEISNIYRGDVIRQT